MQLLFREDAYAKSCPAIVTAVDERGIRLDRCIQDFLDEHGAAVEFELVTPDTCLFPIFIPHVSAKHF